MIGAGGSDFHERANHEDKLHIGRTGLFINFNGFLAVAVGLVNDLVVKIVFVFLVATVDLAWGLSARNAQKFIRALRDAGGIRADEKLWRTTVGTREEKHWWFRDPLTITSIYIPWVLTAGWFMILGYLSFWRKEGGVSLDWMYWSSVGQVIQTIVVVLLAPIATWQLVLQVKATRDQVNASLRDTIATVISLVQSDEIRASRALLHKLEEEIRISGVPHEQWKDDWKEAADRVCQSFNSAGLILKLDPRLQDIYIRPSKTLILESWNFVQPRFKARREKVQDLWPDFEWLVGKASQS